MNKYLALLRPHQWLKNLLVFFPPFFAGKIFEPTVLKGMIPAFVSFSFAASCCYIINDIVDRKSDLQHPEKKNRPFINGDISIAFGVVLAALLYIVAIFMAASISQGYEAYLILYLFCTFGYTFFFKNVVILDVFFIALGFLIRVYAGGEAFGVQVSNWLFLTVFIVAIFLATGKRFGELITLGEDAARHRSTLGQYPPYFLEGMLWFSGAAALVMYSLYTIENKIALFYTVPIAVFGLLRYIFIVKQGAGDPTRALLRDLQILFAGIIWIAIIAIMLYGKNKFLH